MEEQRVKKLSESNMNAAQEDEMAFLLKEVEKVVKDDTKRFCKMQNQIAENEYLQRKRNDCVDTALVLSYTLNFIVLLLLLTMANDIHKCVFNVTI